MKKWIGILLVLLISAGAAATYLYISRPAVSRPEMAALLPDDTLFTLKVVQLQKTVDEFRQSPLGRVLSSLDLEELGRRLGVDPKTTGEAVDSMNQMGRLLESPWFNEIFGDEALMALLPVDPASDGERSSDALQRSPVVIARPRRPAELIDAIGKWLAKDITITQETADGQTLNRIQQPDGPAVYYVVHEGLALMALAPQPLFQCMALSASPESSLAASDAYRWFESEQPVSEAERFRFLWNLEAFSRLILDAAPLVQPDAPDLESLESMRAYLSGIRMIGGVHMKESDTLVRQNITALVDAASLHPLVAGALAHPPEKNATLVKIPESALYYTWQNGQDLSRYWQMAIETGSLSPEDRQEISEGFRETFGVSLEEALAAFGPQWVWLLNDVHMGALAPIPELAMSVQTSRPELFYDMMRHLASRAGMSLENGTHGGKSLHHVPTPLGETVNPAFGCDEGFCTLATSQHLLKRLLVPEPGRGLVDNPGFRAVAGDFEAPGNQVVYCDLGRLFGKTRAVIAWAASWASIDRENAEKRHYALDSLVYPILDALGMYQGLAIRTVVGKDRVTAHATLTVNAKSP